MSERTPDLDILSDTLNLADNEVVAVVITVQDTDEEHLSLNILSKLDAERIIFLLQESLLYLNVKANAEINAEINTEVDDIIENEEILQEEVMIDMNVDFVESDDSMFAINPEDMIAGSIIDPIKSNK